MPDTVSFDDIRWQGFPFYSGEFTYEFPVNTTGNRMSVRIPAYRGALIKVAVDDDEELIAYPPYKTEFAGLSAGKHTVRITDYVPRSNGFAPLHDMAQYEYQSPNAWRKPGDRWNYHYRLYCEGLLADPQIKDLTEN